MSNKKTPRVTGNETTNSIPCYEIPYFGWVTDLFELAHTRNKGNPNTGAKPPRGWSLLKSKKPGAAVLASNTNRNGIYYALEFPLIGGAWTFPKLSDCLFLIVLFDRWRWAEKEVKTLSDIPNEICVPLSELRAIGPNSRTDHKAIETARAAVKMLSQIQIYESSTPFEEGKAPGNRPYTLFSGCYSRKKNIFVSVSETFLKALDRGWTAAKNRRYGGRLIAYIPRQIMNIDPRMRKAILAAVILSIRYSMNSKTRNRYSLDKLKSALLFGPDRHWLTPGETGRPHETIHQILDALSMADLIGSFEFTGANPADSLPDPRRIKNGNLAFTIPAIDDTKRIRTEQKAERKKTKAGL